jgi:hypothetical protein
MPTNNNAQSGGVNPNSLPWFKRWVIMQVLVDCPAASKLRDHNV